MTKEMARTVWYEIRVQGCIGSAWADWFGGLTITQVEDESIIVGQVRDQAALFGLLNRVRDLGLMLIAVNRTQPQAGHSAED